MKVLTFDVELAPNAELEALEEGQDIWKAWPFNISVAATHCPQDPTTDLWHDAPDELTENTANQLLDYLLNKQEEGFAITTWSGVGFDLRLLSRLTYRESDVKHLTLKSYDPQFQFFMEHGYLLGQNRVAQGFGLPLKPMTGKQAPELWKQGEYIAVMDYVIHDVHTLAKIVTAIQVKRGVRWVSRAGAIRFEPMRQPLTVEECLQLPDPDQSWMDEPIKKERLIGWLSKRS